MGQHLLSHKINIFHQEMLLIKRRNCYEIDMKITCVSIKISYIYFIYLFFGKVFEHGSKPTLATPHTRTKTMENLSPPRSRAHNTLDNVAVLYTRTAQSLYRPSIYKSHCCSPPLPNMAERYMPAHPVFVLYSYCIVPIQTSIEAKVNLSMKL